MDPSFGTKVFLNKTEADILSSLEAIAETNKISYEDLSKVTKEKLQNVRLTIESASEFYFRIRNIVQHRIETSSAQLQNLFFDYVTSGFLEESSDSQFRFAKQNNQGFALARYYLRLGYQDAFLTIYQEWDNLGLSKEQRYALYDEMGPYYRAPDLFKKINQAERIYLLKTILKHIRFDILPDLIDLNGFEGMTPSEIYELFQLVSKECDNPKEWIVAQHINHLGLETLPLHDRVVLCKMAMKTPYYATQYAQELCVFALNELTNEERVVFYEETITGEYTTETLEHFEKFGLEDITLEQKIQLYKSISNKPPNGIPALYQSHQKWKFEETIAKIEDVSQRVAFIKRLAELNEHICFELVNHLDILKLDTATRLEKLDLCRLLKDQTLFYKFEILQELRNMSSFSQKLTYCKEIAEFAGHAAMGIINHFDELGLKEANDDDLIDLFRKITLSSTLGAITAITNFRKFRVISEETRFEIFMNALARFPDLLDYIQAGGPFFALELANERNFILLAQYFLQIGRPKNLDNPNILKHIQSDATKRQMYLELLRPPSTLKDECTSNFSLCFPKPINTIIPIIRIRDGTPIDKDALDLFITFVRSTPKLRLLVPFLDDILKKEEYLQCVLLEWIAYTAGMFYDLPEERISSIEKFGVLKDIYEHHNRNNRFIFTSLLRYQDFYPEIPLSNSWGRLSLGLVFSLFEREAAIELLSMIEKTKFKDPKRYNSLVQLLHEISCLGKALNKEHLHLIATKIKSTLNLRAKKQKKGAVKQKRIIEIISETFETLTNILKIFGKSELLSCLELGKDPQESFIENFQSFFTIQDTQNFAEQYQNTFAKFRNPMALFTYLRSIKYLPSSERSSMLLALNTYVNAVLQGTLPHMRYNADQSAHVEKIFTLVDKTDWTESAKPFDFKIEKSQVIRDYRTFFLQKIDRDKHVERTLVPRLIAYLKNEYWDVVESEKELDIFQHYAIQLCEGEITSEEFISKVEGMSFIKADFRHDLSTLSPKMSCGKYSISESDEACDLLMLGIEIQGSCQRVDGTPNLNKGLLSYLMNGEIRAIVVKKQGKIVARSVIRLLLDIRKNTPVILLERIYSNFNEEKIREEIISWALNKARAMDLPLVSVEVMTKDSIPYNGAISSLGGYAPFTYSDACSGIQSGPFTIVNCYEIK